MRPDGSADVLLYTSEVSIIIGDTTVGSESEAVTYALAGTNAGGELSATLTEAMRIFGQPDESRFELVAAEEPTESVLSWAANVVE